MSIWEGGGEDKVDGVPEELWELKSHFSIT